MHSIDGENVARGVLGFFELIFFAVSVLLQKRVICRPPENNFNQQLVHLDTVEVPYFLDLDVPVGVYCG